MPTLHELPTPALVLDRARLDANIQRMADQLARFPHVRFRPHLKTSKCIEIAHLVAGRGGAVTVSTLREAEVFAAAGFADILYAVGISPDKLPRVVALLRGNTALTVIVDSVAAAAAVADHAEVHALRIPTLIEIDTDGHRGGLRPDDPRIAAIGARLGRHLDGVLTHAGESYFAAGHDEIRAYARLERDGITAAAAQLRAAGLPCPVVSVGSTPTALFTDALSGVTEMRAGVYAFQDLVMAGIGVCTPEQIALSVLTTVIGQQPGRLLVDAGWMAMSRDRGTQRQAVDMAYGLVRDVSGMPLADLLLSGANQEHGIVSGRAGGPIDPARFPIGSRLRILPNHACATAAQHPAYHVLEEGRVTAHWPRFAHW